MTKAHNNLESVCIEIRSCRGLERVLFCNKKTIRDHYWHFQIALKLN